MKNFKKLELIQPLQRALETANYETPTPIQAKAIPYALQGRDVLACAQTGTGKTAAFALPTLNRLAKQKDQITRRRPRALILAPTRELAVQIGDSFATYGKYLDLRQALVYGGVSQQRQVQNLDRGPHIVIATPGRLIDLMGQGYVQLKELDVFVLDEADRMLDMGFLPDLKRIVRALPKRRQSLFFSATLPRPIVELSRSLLREPATVNVTPKSVSVKAIEQRVLFVERSEKLACLQAILLGEGVDRALVFTRTKRGASHLTKKLARGGISAAAIHGDKSQNARQSALTAFRKRQVQVLVATDVASRGIDVDGITHVVNWDLPHEPESYVHRIGRTGRAGADGIAVSFCTSEEHSQLRAIERLIGKKVPRDLNPYQPQAKTMAVVESEPRSKPSNRNRRRGRKRQSSQSRIHA